LGESALSPLSRTGGEGGELYRGGMIGRRGRGDSFPGRREAQDAERRHITYWAGSIEFKKTRIGTLNELKKWAHFLEKDDSAVGEELGSTNYVLGGKLPSHGRILIHLRRTQLSG